MMVTFAELGPADFRSVIDGFVAVYAAAMNPPERMLTGRDAIMDRHAANPGFRALAALVDGNALAGFSYGFHGVPGQWWHDMVAGALALAPVQASWAPGAPGAPGRDNGLEAAGGADAPGGRDGKSGQGERGGQGARGGQGGQGRGARAWLDDSFEVAELHVLPAYQGMGIGRELLLRVTADREERTAVLSTADTESPARRLYRGLGFTDLLTGFRFSGGEPPYAVMGATLPLCPPGDAAGEAPRSPSPSN